MLLLIITSSLWTVSTLIIKIYGLVVFGQFWANYLVVYPILAFLEWVVPVYYVVLAVRLRRYTKNLQA
jgi:hypothetical protein